MEAIKGYDAWRLSGPDDHAADIGTEAGEECGRYHETDEDAPRGYKPKPCKGVMIDDGVVRCDTCGEGNG
jgi:hypothetical protein